MVDVGDRFGPYTCMRKLGAGGMAETFLAVQRGVAGFEQRVCMKFIAPAHEHDQNFRALFLREASIAASLRHSNVVGVIDVDQERGYIVLELVDGVDLRALLNAAPNHRLPPPVVTLIAIELGKALAYAHSRTLRGEPAGVVHRDISPSNVLISYAGEVKLTDFGIAKAMHAEHEPKSETIKGKLCYMSPEQTRGESLDGRSDLFSLGIVCYELLSGRRPFDGTTDAETIIRVNEGEHVPLAEAAPDVPGGLARVVELALSKERQDRFPDADAFIDALSRFAGTATAYRELGQLARDARPHETLSTADLGLDVEAAELRRMERAVTVSAESPRGPRETRDERRGRVSRPSATPPRRAFADVSLRAWLTLGASVGVFAAVTLGLAFGGLPNALSATAARATNDASARAAVQPTTIARPAPEAVAHSPATAAEPPAHPRADAAVELTELVNAGRPAAPEPSAPAAAAARAPAAPATSNAEHVTRSATLRIGTIPIGQVWVDGKAAGWSPVSLNVMPGRHVIAGGGENPQVEREVRLRAGEHRQLVISLDEATAGKADR